MNTGSLMREIEILLKHYLIVVGLEASILNECGESPLAFPDYIIPQDEKRIKATSSSVVMICSMTNQLK